MSNQQNLTSHLEGVFPKKKEDFSYLFLFFFLPFTCFSKLLSLWLITEDDEILRSVGFDDSAVVEICSCVTALGCFNVENKDGKLVWVDSWAVFGCATGISGIPKNFFTPGFFSAAKVSTNTTNSYEGKIKRNILQDQVIFFFFLSR